MKPIKHIFKLVLIILCITGNAQELKLNKNQSKLNWTGKAAFNSYSLTGSLKVKEGSITIEGNKIMTLEITIDMKSLDHENTDLKSHLRNEDFFEVNTFKTATFSILKPVTIDNNKAILVGKMTIKNITKEETIQVDISKNVLTFSHIIDRTTYDVKFNSPSLFKKMKENAIADEFLLEGKLIFY